MKLNTTHKNKDLLFLEGGGHMGELIGTMDWDNTTLGCISSWPVSLRTTLAIILHSSYPMFFFWGDELICFYNDAFRPSLGIDGKHPAIGKKGKEVWSEIWDFIGPLIDQVITTAQPVSFSDQLVPFYRNGRMEDIYWTFCYSAAFDDYGNVNGVVVTCTETTETVLTKKELQESERRLRTMITQAPVSIAIFRGMDHITEMANSLALEMWGRREEEVLDQPILEAMPELKSQGIKELLDEVYCTGNTFSTSEFSVQIMRKEKLETAYLNFSFEPLLDTTGEIEGIMALGIEVTDQVNARKKIEESEKKYKELIFGLPVAVYTCDADGYVQLYNESAVRLWGRTPKVGKDLWCGSWKIFTNHGTPLPLEDCPMAIALKGGEIINPELEVERPDGTRVNFVPYPQPIYNSEGEITGAINTLIEITDQVVARLKIKESEIRFKAIADNIPNLAWMAHDDGSIYWYNKKWYDFTGTSPDEMQELGWEFFHDPEILPDVLANWQYSVEYGKKFEMIFPMRDANNTYRQFLTRVLPVYDDKGKISKWFGSNTDITEHVRAQRKLEESEKKFRLLADSLPQFVWTSDPKGNLNYFNQSVFEYSGLSLDHLINQGWLNMVHPDDREENIRTWEDSIATGKDFLLEHRFRRHDGEYRWQLSLAKPQRNGGGNIQMWVGSSTDIQEQKIFRDELEKQVKERTAELLELNESLKKSEQRYHLMVEEVQDYAIIYLNPEGIVENWNTGAEKIKGYKAEEIIGRNFSNFYTEEDRKTGLPKRLLGLATKNNKAVQEGWRVRKDKTLFWASVVITAIHNEENEVIGYSKVTHDLTTKKASDDALKEKKVELEQKNTELQKMNKELQSFAYISSHDLQEPLRKIQTFASRIIEKDKDTLSENGKYLFKRMQLSAERMQSLIDDLLAYSRTHNLEGDFEKINLNDIIEQVKQDLSEELLQKNAIIDSDKTCEVNIIPFQFKQLFYNLISNSLKFSNPERPVHITIRNEYVDGNILDGEGFNDSKNYCHITFSDNGIGFDQEYSEKIFELFQRLHGKTEYPGTGIGLAIIKRIVENHHGIITAKGELGKGATFNIYLPVGE
ncbi:PAS domain S-box protein [Arenibacter sp. F26102]|uniref:PAS domain S-box protein n=1 Tax=Arenibacter sp. F26102 TaxID=2926416 RepID=UPI001FF479B3|nr:PAS domain S-box protein [Arenibacter sp. F26102]MCK0145668.1 PAS domain S-box protein [Arenibacter sp. F26102]